MSRQPLWYSISSAHYLRQLIKLTCIWICWVHFFIDCVESIGWRVYWKFKVSSSVWIKLWRYQTFYIIHILHLKFIIHVILPSLVLITINIWGRTIATNLRSVCSISKGMRFEVKHFNPSWVNLFLHKFNHLVFLSFEFLTYCFLLTFLGTFHRVRNVF